MTCPRCARDLLALALDAQARGDTAVLNLRDYQPAPCGHCPD
jgi:hypothetical protein